jgi:sulfide:quinone oxidoreductase
VRGRTRVLIAGGGVAALEAALALQALGEDRVEVELLAPEFHFWYRPLAVTEPYRLGATMHFELVDLATAAGATFSPGALVSVDPQRHLVHTSPGGALSYDVLLIACGAVPEPAIRGALTFRGPADTDKVEHLLAEIEAGSVRNVAFAVPSGAAWNLPAYELALMTAAWIAARQIAGVELALVTPEAEPLQLFGRQASDAIQALLDERGIAVHTSAHPAEVRDGELRLVPDGVVAADRVVALPRLKGQRIDGIPQTAEEFIPVDMHGHVIGVGDVFAAGDITSFPVKQGGIAAQQADAAAGAIAAAAGAPVTPQPFRPILRGLLLTGTEPRYLRHEIAGGLGDMSLASPDPLWWPPGKIVGRHLAPFLAERAGHALPADMRFEPGAVPIDVELPAELDTAASGAPDPSG